MSTPFTPVGPSGIIAYADDSSDVRIPTTGANALWIYNPDTANVVAVTAGYVEGDQDAIIPTSDFNGEGVIIGPQETMIYRLPNAAFATGNIYICVAGDSATGNVYVCPGTL